MGIGISSFIKAKPNIIALNLDDCNIGNIDIEKIKSLIKSINNSNITYLDIGYNKITDVVATAIATMPNLTHLYIGSNNITDIGATAIATMPNLTHLRIEANNITDIGTTAIATMPNLTYLDIGYNKITDVGITAIATIPNLTYLDIGHSKITDVSATAIATMPNLTYLDIGYSKITDVGATAIATMPNLTHLRIEANNITDVGGTAMPDMPNLTHLDIGYNKITDVGATAIANKLSKLIRLDISSNEITAEGATAIATMPNLTYLNIGYNKITDVGATAIANKLSKLIHLSISSNEITAEGVTAIADMPNLTCLNIHINKIIEEGVAIAKALKDNTILINLGIWRIESDIHKILERNKKIKDISEAFKPIISKITLDTDGTPLLSLDTEGSEQNSCLNKLKGYSEKYKELFLPVLKQSIAQSLYQDTVHVHKDGTEQLSFAARSDTLIKVIQAILERSGFKEEDINEFNSKIVEIIEEVKEMFWLELDILNNNLMNTDEIDVQTNTFDLKKPLEFLCYHEFIVGEGLKPSFDFNINVESLNDQQKVELKNNQQLTDLYEKHPELKMPGTILRDFLKSDSTIYLNTARELKQHTDEQTFKHNPQIQKLLNEFTIEFDNISAIELHESPLAPEQKEAEALLAQHSDSHLPNISEHTSIGLAIDDPMTLVLGDSSHHITD